MESSHRDLLNDMAEHGFISEIRDILSTPVVFTPKTGIELPKTGVSFLQ